MQRIWGGEKVARETRVDGELLQLKGTVQVRGI